MLILPPPAKPARDRRVGERRAADRRRSAKPVDRAKPVDSPEPVDGAAETGATETVAPDVRTRGRSGGRRKTDRAQPQDAASPFAGVSKPHAPLVAQLIATALGMEQTRVKRRGSAEDAAALYGRKAERKKRTRGVA